MRKNNIIWVVAVVCGLTLQACTTTTGSDSADGYQNNVITPTLEIPPDLISRKSGKNLVLPGSKVGTKENTGRFVESGNLNTTVQ